MNLFFRLLLVFIRASLSKERLSVFDTAVLRSRVMLTDQDMFAHMTNSRYFSFSDLGVINYIVRTGCWPKLRKQGWFPVVMSETVVFTRMLRAHQRFEVHTRLAGWTDTFICLEHTFLRDRKKTACVRLVARFAGRKGEKVSMQDITTLLGIEDTSPALPEAFRTMIEQIDAARLEGRPARAGMDDDGR